MNNQKFLTAEPTIVRFLAPPFWSVATPRVDYNGASGTIQINNYAKGDRFSFFVFWCFVFFRLLRVFATAWCFPRV